MCDLLPFQREADVNLPSMQMRPVFDFDLLVVQVPWEFGSRQSRLRHCLLGQRCESAQRGVRRQLLRV